MPDSFVTRDEFIAAQNRMDARVSLIEQNTASMKVSAESIHASVAQMHAVLYGDKQDGVLFTVNTLRTKMGAVQWLVVTTTTALISAGAAKVMGWL